jgi:hypothetical protein
MDFTDSIPVPASNLLKSNTYEDKRHYLDRNDNTCDDNPPNTERVAEGRYSQKSQHRRRVQISEWPNFPGLVKLSPVLIFALRGRLLGRNFVAFRIDLRAPWASSAAPAFAKDAPQKGCPS